MYGWELASQLQEVGVVASIGTLYPLLARVRERGAVTVATVPNEFGPPRKYYSLTDIGRIELTQFRSQWQSFVENVNQTIGSDGA